jgi:hypothetical protein
MHDSLPTINADELLASRASLAADVVYREFPSETIVLNLATGKYHGLDPVGGRMLALLERVPSIGAAVAPLAAEFGQPIEVIERDLRDFCGALRARGLISVAPAE